MYQPSNQESFIDPVELIFIILRGWKIIFLTCILTGLGGVACFKLAQPLFKAQTIITIADAEETQAPGLLGSIGGSLLGKTSPSDKIKLYLQSSSVIEKAIRKLNPESLKHLGEWLETDFTDPSKADRVYRGAAYGLIGELVVSKPPLIESGIILSIFTPSRQLSLDLIASILQELRAFHKELNEGKRQNREKFFAKESKTYRRKLLEHSLAVSDVTVAGNGLIEATPESLDLEGELEAPIKVSPQLYFEYKLAIQDMYKSFSQSFEERYQGIKIEKQKDDRLYDIIDPPYASYGPASPSLVKVIMGTTILSFLFSSLAVFSKYILDQRRTK